jgi:asparagine synthase (glutamine-hydrolysing)
MGMANSLEIRFPFLDYKLVDYILSLPDGLKHSNKLLVDSTKGWIPEDVIKKNNIDFALPWGKWMRNELSSFCEESISNLEYYPHFNMSKVNLLWIDFLKGNPNVNWIQIWSLVVLGKWTCINLSINKN